MSFKSELHTFKNRVGAYELIKFARDNNISVKKSKNGIFFYGGDRYFKKDYSTKLMTTEQYHNHKPLEKEEVIQKAHGKVRIKYKKSYDRQTTYFSFEEDEVKELVEELKEQMNDWKYNKGVLR